MSDKHWYIVQAYSNFERKVADSIREQAKQRHLEHLFDEVMVPTEKVVEVRRGQKVDAERFASHKAAGNGEEGPDDAGHARRLRSVRCVIP